MDINKAYNICMGIILVLLFVGAYVLGVVLHCAEDTVPKSPAKAQEITLLSEEGETSCEAVASAEGESPEEDKAELCNYTESKYYYDIPLSDERQDYVFKLCGEYDLPCELVFAIMGAESDYTDGQVSASGDYGIMQINRVNLERLREALGINDLLDFEQNVLCGIYMLSEYYHKYSDFNKIAMCYRSGEYGAQQRWEKGIYSTEYTGKVVRAIALLEYRC